MFCKQEGGKEGRAEREDTAAEAKRKETTRSTTVAPAPCTAGPSCRCLLGPQRISAEEAEECA